MARPRVVFDRLSKLRGRADIPQGVAPAAHPTDTSTAAAPRRSPTAKDDVFFEALGRTGDLGAAAVAATRRRLRAGDPQSRLLAQALQKHGGAVGQIGDICLAVATVFDDRPTNAELPSDAWRMFSAADLDEVLRLAPAEYLRTAFGHDRSGAISALAGLLSGADRTEADAADWFDIAATSSWPASTGCRARLWRRPKPDSRTSTTTAQPADCAQISAGSGRGTRVAVT